MEIPKTSRFTIRDLKNFVTERYPTKSIDVESEGQANIDGYLEEYFCECMRKDSGQFWHIVRNSVVYGAGVACSASYFLFIMSGVQAFNIGFFSLLVSAAVFFIALAVGCKMEKINGLLLELSDGGLLTNPRLRNKIHKLLIKFYNKSITKIRIFAQFAELTKNVMISIISLMYMVTAPSINEENSSTYVPDWCNVVIPFFALIFSMWGLLMLLRNIRMNCLSALEPKLY